MAVDENPQFFTDVCMVLSAMLQHTSLVCTTIFIVFALHHLFTFKQRQSAIQIRLSYIIVWYKLWWSFHFWLCLSCCQYLFECQNYDMCEGTISFTSLLEIQKMDTNDYSICIMQGNRPCTFQGDQYWRESTGKIHNCGYSWMRCCKRCAMALGWPATCHKAWNGVYLHAPRWECISVESQWKKCELKEIIILEISSESIIFK